MITLIYINILVAVLQFIIMDSVDGNCFQKMKTDSDEENATAV